MSAKQYGHDSQCGLSTKRAQYHITFDKRGRQPKDSSYPFRGLNKQEIPLSVTLLCLVTVRYNQISLQINVFSDWKSRKNILKYYKWKAFCRWKSSGDNDSESHSIRNIFWVVLGYMIYGNTYDICVLRKANVMIKIACESLM